VTKHSDVKEISRLSEVFSNSLNTTVVRYNEDITAEQLDIQRENLLIDMDEPKHRILRRIVSPLFTPKAVNGLHERLVVRARGIVEAAAEKSSGNFVSDIASVLPMHAIADLVGIPESDRQQVLDWTNQMFAYDDPAIGKDTATTATVSMLGYAYAMAEERQLNPRDDILTGLVQGAYEDRPLTPLEFAYFVIQLMVAGNETSRNAITHGVLAFADNPAQWELYRECRPQTTADEIIRWASPIIAFQRTALQDVDLGGVRIQKGQRVGMFYASANFDEDVFDDPFTFKIERDPNPRLAFGGHGIHYCLGANLARLEIGIMFDAMADTLPDLMPTGEPTRFRSGWINGVVSLPASYRG
jgi:cholest-4-en-3-one 26-monooxygenase